MVPTIPGYEIENELGRGGMGVVYKCRQLATGSTVALKLMLQGLGASREALARFRVEAEALACLDHPNITRILDVGVVSGCPFFVTEYARHGTIRDFATRQNKSVDWCVDAIRQIALAVHHANTRWMIHRDIKPSNILIADDEIPKITDFGLVKFTTRVKWVATASRAPDVDHSFAAFDEFLEQFSQELAFQYGDCAAHETVSKFRDSCLARTGLPEEAISLRKLEQFLEETASYEAVGAGEFPPPFPELEMLTQPDAILGSPQFMAPEQARGQLHEIGPKTDVYGLGATLYWLLTGEPVFRGRTIGEILEKIQARFEFPIPASDLNANIPRAVDCVVWKALQKDPPRRYPNCKVLAEELQCCLSGVKPNAQLSRERQMNLIAEQEAKEKAESAKYANLFKKAFPPKH